LESSSKFLFGLIVGGAAAALIFVNYCVLFTDASIVFALAAFVAGIPWSVLVAAAAFLSDSGPLERWMLGTVASMPCRGSGGGWPALEAVFWVPAMVGVFINAQILFHLRARNRA